MNRLYEHVMDKVLLFSNLYVRNLINLDLEVDKLNIVKDVIAITMKI